jgi:hypothetical protein
LYTRLVTNVRQGHHIDLYRIRTTNNAITKDYARVISGGSRDNAAKYTEFEDIEEQDVDVEHYVNIIKSTLNLICKCIGLFDHTFITHKEITLPKLITNAR